MHISNRKEICRLGFRSIGHILDIFWVTKMTNKLMDSFNLCEGPLRCPLTGSTLQLLNSKEEVLAINRDLKEGKLSLVAGTMPRREVDEVLTSSVGQNQYPIIGGIPCLLGDFRIVRLSENNSKNEIA
jgi:uncharacterized protein YbaR (Trm112 family)